MDCRGHELAALQAAGRLTREAAFDILFPDIAVKGNRDAAAANAGDDMIVERLDKSQVVRALKVLADTGAVTIRIKEPENFPVKFNWTVTVAVDGTTTSTALRIDHGQYEAEVDALRANLAEIRATANGNAAAEKAGVRFLDCLCGKSVQPGYIGRFMKAALAAQPGEYAKLSTASTPKQLVQAVIDMRAAVDKVLRGTHVTDVLDGGPEITAASDFAASLIFSRFPSARLQAAADAFRGETTRPPASAPRDGDSWSSRPRRQQWRSGALAASPHADWCGTLRQRLPSSFVLLPSYLTKRPFPS